MTDVNHTPEAAPKIDYAKAQLLAKRFLDMDSCERLEKSTGSALNKPMQNIALLFVFTSAIVACTCLILLL